MSTEPIDDVIVERLTRGIRVAANDAERRAAVEIMHTRGYTESVIARRIHSSTRKVREYLGLSA